MSSKLKGERAAIGVRLQSARERANLSIEDAAKAAEVQPLAVVKWERGAALPSLLELRALLELYGVMACGILFEHNPWELQQDEMAELIRAGKDFSPSLRAKVDCLVAMLGKGKEPVWREGPPTPSIYGTRERPIGSSSGGRPH
jgi:transcriptional regulator with XRE-family HTH domain